MWRWVEVVRDFHELVSLFHCLHSGLLAVKIENSLFHTTEETFLCKLVWPEK